MAEKLSIQERFDVLVEAINFFSDLSAAGEWNEKLWRIKAAALSTVEECLLLYQRKMLNEADWTEETLAEWLKLSINEDYIDKMVASKKMSEEEADFYRGWFWLAVWILMWDDISIDGLRELEKQYEEIEDYKINSKSIEDLLK